MKVACAIYQCDVQMHHYCVRQTNRSNFFWREYLFLLSIAPYDRDNRNRRFTVDTFLAMHGPPGPPGLSGPTGSPGLRGAVGPQGTVGRSKEPVPIVAFVAHLQKMLSVASNRSETIVFEVAQMNDGKGYNPTTGIFTAPHRGIYKFSMTIMAQMDSIVCFEGISVFSSNCSYRQLYALYTINEMFSA